MADPRSSNNLLLSTVLTAEAVGLCVLPPTEDGTKQPDGMNADGSLRWKRWQLERPTVQELTQWYSSGRTGVGLVCGHVSDNLELFEFDDRSIYDSFKTAAEAIDLGDLATRVESGCSDETPNGGIHWYYRCDEIPASTKLARRPGPLDANGKATVDTLIETKGEGGYAVIAPSNGKVHPTGKAYLRLQGNLETIVTLSADERSALFELARTFDAMPKREDTRGKIPAVDADGKPGDDFNKRTEWGDLLEKVGWKWVYRCGEVDYWRRPGKSIGVSATTNYGGSDLFYCFSSSTPFDTERGYSKFAVYTLLNHASDFAASAKDLAGRGYGSPAASSGRSNGAVSATPVVAANSNGSTQRPPQRRMAFTADQLLDADLPEAKWLAPGMITEGLVILAGRPKIGKSWLALQLALAVGVGGVFLGQGVTKGKVVYFALEDSPKRLKRRMKSLGWSRGADVQFYFDLKPLGGTLEGLPSFIEAIQPDLVIIDTSSRAMPAGAKTKDTNAVTCILSPIQQAAVQEACTVMLVDHYRKPQGMVPESVDHLEEVMDSTAKVAVADTIIGLARKRGERGATLKITGRDLEDDIELAINHDMETGCWQLLGDASEVRRSERQRKVIAALRSFNAYTAGTTEIAERAGLMKSHTSEVIQELVTDGLVERLPRQGPRQPYRLIVPNGSNSGNYGNSSNSGNSGNYWGDSPDGSHCSPLEEGPETPGRHDSSHCSHSSHSSEGGSPSLNGDDREQVVF